LKVHQESIDKHNKNAAHKKYGYKSKEHIMAERKKATINKENIYKIEQFLQQHGHPSEKLHGSKLADLPFTIFSASSKSKKLIQRNLTYIHTAWQQQTISDRTYIYYLQSLHSSKFKQFLRLNSPSYTEKEEIDSLATKLKIDSLLSVYK